MQYTPIGDSPMASSRVTVRVCMSDVDRMHIWFGSYARWMDLGYSELFAVLGHPHSAIFDTGFACPIVSMSVDYRLPVGMDDLVEIESSVSRVGTTSFDIRHEFTCKGALVAAGAMTHVWLDTRSNAPAPVPGWLQAASAVRMGGEPA